ncbi:MAG: ribosome assembly RNA-binding protein YhbY [Deltaproteobacteria bacterium]|nr:MAG: ribosome assembly RNA-binding protein YhbY [Deltaproteobacteria bacterium]
MTTDQTKPQKKLTTGQKKYLKGLAHPLKPIVLVGKEGLSPSLVKMTLQELQLRELIKIKLGQNCGVDKKQAALELAEKTDSSLVQLIGKTIVLYKANTKKKDGQIRLPTI